MEGDRMQKQAGNRTPKGTPYRCPQPRFAVELRATKKTHITTEKRINAMGAYISAEIVVGETTVSGMKRAFDELVDECILKYGDSPYNGELSTCSGASIPRGFNTTPIPDYLADYIADTHWEGYEGYLQPKEQGGAFKKWDLAIALPVKFLVEEGSNCAYVGWENENKYDVSRIRVSTSDIMVNFSDFTHTSLNLSLDLSNRKIREKVEDRVDKFRKDNAGDLAGIESAPAWKVQINKVFFEFPKLKKGEIKRTGTALSGPLYGRRFRLSDIIGERTMTVKIRVSAIYREREWEIKTGWLFSGMCAE